jgi:hypothetical protein
MTISYQAEKQNGRKTGQILATLGSLTTGGPTKTEAADRLLAEAAEAYASVQHAYVFTQHGEILAVHFQYGQWGYDIVRQDGPSYCPSCWGCASSFADTLDRACRHADQSYGGVVTIKRA